MYLGRVVESAPADAVFARPNHPYTQALLAEAGKVEPKKRTFVPIKSESRRRSIRRPAVTSIRAVPTSWTSVACTSRRCSRSRRAASRHASSTA